MPSREAGGSSYRFEILRSASATWSGISSYDFAAERVFFGAPAGGTKWGVQIAGTAPTLSSIPTDTNPHTLIAVLDFDHDQIGLWVDPDNADFYDPSTGDNTADAMGAYIAYNWSSALRFGSGGQTTWDELTVGLDPASVGLGTNITDLDNDGLPGTWEATHNLNDNDDGTTGESSPGAKDGPNGALGDPDADGLTNAQELALQTDPKDEDSDNDGYSDGDEAIAGTNPNNPASYPGAVNTDNLVGIEPFDYPNGAIAGRKGGSYWDFDNSTENDAFFGHTTTSSNWSATGGSPQVADGVLLTQNSSAKREYNGPGEGTGGGSDERFGSFSDNAQFNQHVVYYKFEMTRRAGATWAGASSFDFGTERYLFGVPNATNPATGKREFAIHDLNANQHGYSGIEPIDDQLYTLVAKLDFDNKLAALYLDPNLSAPEGSQTPVATYPHTSSNWSSSIRFGSGGSGNVEWDQLRVATTWEALNDGPPVANDDAITMHQLGKARLQVLTNDTGSIKPSSLSILSGPSSGTAIPSPDGTILYEHTTGLPPTDSFTYQVENSDGSLSDTATVTVTLTTNTRFNSNFVTLPTTPPVTALGIEDAFPGLTFDSPHDFGAIPGDPRKLLVTEGDGRVFLIPDVGATPATKTEILNITSQVRHDNNEFAMKGIAAHPDWANNGYIYVTYNAVGGTVRLSRFTCLTTSPFTASSELILIDQVNDDVFHNISTCKFGVDGYLYVGFGDEGTQSDGLDNSQHIDKDLWSCLIRIDVDKQAANLIPHDDADIPRVGGGSSGEAHYRVPADNPFVGATTFNGITLDPTKVRTEIFILGQRNPWQFSPEDNDGNGTVDEVWIGDVGRSNREEIGVYTVGQNGGWAWREGTAAGIRSGQLINGAAQAAATLTEPLWDYPHGGGTFQGNSITGGFVYRGNALPALTGKFICADYVSGNIWSIERTMPTPTIERLAGEVAIVALTTDPSNGDILLLDRGNVGGNQGTGGIKRLTVGVDDGGFPATLSATNFFADLTDLSPNPGGEFYEPNLRFWSDFAEKSRWFLINNTSDTVDFSINDPWTYPEGMIFVKHFDYPTEWESFTRTINGASVPDRRPLTNSPRRRVETRFLVRTTTGSYGISYRWNNLNGGSQTEASLADHNGESFDIDITLDGASTSAPWLIPSRTNCLSCHTPEAGHALSFNTRQLNAPGNIAGVSGNMLAVLGSTGYLTGLVGTPDQLPRHLRPDEANYSLEARVRSYLDVNCAYCHQSGGTSGGQWDGRAHLTLAETGLINGIPVDAPLTPGDLLVVPGSVPQSIVYNRTTASNGYSRMPPLATNEIDLEGAELLAAWIASEVQPYATYQDWRLAHFGSSNSPEGAPTANPDGDPGDNDFEWLTNTDPNNPHSHWSPTLRPDPVGGNIAYDFTGLANRQIRILHSEDLVNWSLWPVPGNNGIPRPPGPHTLSGPKNAPDEFFRFEIRPR